VDHRLINYDIAAVIIGQEKYGPTIGIHLDILSDFAPTDQLRYCRSIIGQEKYGPTIGIHLDIFDFAAQYL
jgi:hypothetical protein